jgi:hypothetical protein
MYKLLRDLHLWLGLFVGPLLLMYALSALQMTHPWLAKAEIRTRSFVVQVPAGRDPGAIAQALATGDGVRGVRGALEQVTRDGDKLSLRIAHPGTTYEIVLTSDTQAQVTEKRSNGVDMLNRVHRLAGVWHSLRATNLFGLLEALGSLALLCLGATGLLMWWQRPRDRKLGAWFLAGSVLYSVTLLLLVRLT